VGATASEVEADRLRRVVREGYARVAAGSAGTDEGAGRRAGEDDSDAKARQGTGGCCSPRTVEQAAPPRSTSSCCGTKDVDRFAQRLGYSDADLSGLPEGANLGLSCGNPNALAALQSGEVVVDLGSGAGFDVLIAARKVGESGRVIGVDMTPEMLERARENARKVGAANVEFRLGEIESLPLGDASADVVISNCVINLSPDKPRVFREIFRVLRPGGRVAVSDMALLRPLPEAVQQDLVAYVGCISGAVPVEEYLGQLRAAGFVDVVVERDAVEDPLEAPQDPLYRRMEEKLPAGTCSSDFVTSVRVQARKPGSR
jgi:SAM-dependent methyltransferase